MKTIAHHGGRHHNLTRSQKNKDTHKYEKQAMRTAANKAKHIKKAMELRKSAINNLTNTTESGII